MIKDDELHGNKENGLFPQQMLNVNDLTPRAFNPVGAHRALIDFTLSNARPFYSSMGNPLGVKGIKE